MHESSRAIRILHVIGGMNRGGAETWLMHLLRHSDRRRYEMDFFVHTEKECAFDPEIVSLGSRIFHSRHPRHVFRFLRGLRRVLREEGPYDVVHSHIHHFSGVVLMAAAKESVPVRIAHSHSDNRLAEQRVSLLRKSYLSVMKAAINRYATAGIGCSVAATEALFGDDWRKRGKNRVVYCGIDPSSFNAAVEVDRVRHELGISKTDFVVGHVGRFTAVKNHDFIIDIGRALKEKGAEARFLLVGDGPLRNQIQERVRSFGLQPYFIFAGQRDDVPQLMMGAMDIAILPSLYEGLPLTGIEAQAAGLPIIISSGITSEMDLPESEIHRLSLDDGAEVWADVIARWGYKTAKTTSRKPSSLTGSRFDISRSVTQMSEIYSGW